MLRTWSNCTGNTLIRRAFGDSAMGRSRTYDFFFVIQTWGNFGWSSRAFRLALYRLHRWRNCSNSQNHEQRLMKYHFINCWQVRPFICQWIIREHLNMWWMSMRSVPLLLSDEQSVACVCVPFKVRSNQHSLSKYNSRLNLGLCYNPETKHQSS